MKLQWNPTSCCWEFAWTRTERTDVRRADVRLDGRNGDYLLPQNSSENKNRISTETLHYCVPFQFVFRIVVSSFQWVKISRMYSHSMKLVLNGVRRSHQLNSAVSAEICCQSGSEQVKWSSIRPRSYKKIMFNSAEHETLNSHNYKNIKKFIIYQAQVSLKSFFFCS